MLWGQSTLDKVFQVTQCDVWINRRNKVPGASPSSPLLLHWTASPGPAGCGGAEPGSPWDTPSALSITQGQRAQEVNGILYTLCWSNLPVSAFWAPPSRLLMDKIHWGPCVIWDGLDAVTHCSEECWQWVRAHRDVCGQGHPHLPCSALSPWPLCFLGHATPPDTSCSPSAGSSHAVTKSYVRPDIFQ